MLNYVDTSRKDVVEDFLAWRAGDFNYYDMMVDMMDWRECVREGYTVAEFHLVSCGDSRLKRVKAVL